MNSDSEDKLVEQPGSDRPVGTFLRLVPRDEREQHQAEPIAARKIATSRTTLPRDDDDDPGPTAA
jgi:hypothetical protein